MRKQAAVVTTFAMLALVCWAQDHRGLATNSISGKVVTLNQHPVENARIEVRDALNGSTVQSVRLYRAVRTI